MNTLCFLGLTLQVIGGLIIAWGLYNSKFDLFPGSKGLVRRTWIKLGRRYFNRSVESKRRDANGNGTASETTEHLIRPSSPITNDVEQLRLFTVASIDILHERISEIRRKQLSESNKFQHETKTQLQDLSDSDSETRKQVPEQIGGKNGVGLEIAAWGVLMVVVGTVLSALA